MGTIQVNELSQVAATNLARHPVKKALAAFYSLVAYIAFFATILYAIGFVGNLVVPKSIDSGSGVTTLFAIGINTALLGVFALQHSVMARPFFKRWIIKFIPVEMERSTYVLLSSVALALVFWHWQPMTEIIWQFQSLPAILAISAVYFIGWAVVFLSSFMINHFELFGLKQVFDYCKEQQSIESPFTVRFFYAFVRHPLMLGFLVAMWAAPTMSAGHLLFTVVTTLYILLAVKYLEERDLKRAIGKDYEDYQRRVPMVIPRIGRKSS